MSGFHVPKEILWFFKHLFSNQVLWLKARPSPIHKTLFLKSRQIPGNYVRHNESFAKSA
jgi:hypothetical protein